MNIFKFILNGLVSCFTCIGIVTAVKKIKTYITERSERDECCEYEDE